MKKYKLFLALTGLILFATSCKDDFSEMNKGKDSITNTNPSYLFAQGVLEFEPSPYICWFANAHNFYYCVQTAIPGSSINPDAIVGGSEQQGYQCISVLKYVNALKYERSKMEKEKSDQYECTAAALDVLAVYLGIYDSDFCGDIPFTEAATGRYQGGTLTPKYDRVEDLYNIWLETLNKSIKTFTTASNQIELGNQDVIYKGDWKKWAKLANSLKLKIAARLINQKMDQAKNIVAEVVAAPCGMLDGRNDDFLFHKADENTGENGNDYVYHWNNSTLWYNGVNASQRVVDFLIKNQDPRVRFFYEKNDWNSEVVNYFLKVGRKKDIPSFIMNNVETEVVDGKETFKAWKGMGEPWVRYYGLPVAYNARVNNALYGEWFNYDKNTLAGSKVFRPYSRFQEEMLRGRIDFTLKTIPDGPVIEDKEDNPWYGMYMTTAEVNLYLAEFATYGGVNGLQNASIYFDKAVRASVEEYNRLAGLNKIPYYGKTYDYDKNESVIDLKAGEIDAMMAHDDYKLTGDKALDLEKIYLQQILHFTYQPVDQFVTGRRSGCPKFNSKLIAREDYAANNIPADLYPRRTSVSAPLPTDLMYNIIKKSYEQQGFSTTFTPGILNKERVWQDKNAPQWGEGPKL